MGWEKIGPPPEPPPAAGGPSSPHPMGKSAAMSRKALRDERKTGNIDSQIVEARSMGPHLLLEEPRYGANTPQR
jgi:hypothetical protein